MRIKRCVEELLQAGYDDWEDAAGVASIAIIEGRVESVDEIRELSLEMIRHVVRQGFMELGELAAGEGFRKWDLPMQECLDRVEHEWKALGRNPKLSEICWLCNTAKGNEIGKHIEDLWNEPQDCAEKLIMMGSRYGPINYGCIDWVAGRIGGASGGESTLQTGLQLIRKLVEEELMDVGDFTKKGFSRWNLPIQKCLKRIEDKWRTMAREDKICWIQNTDKGRELGEQLLAKMEAKLA